MNAEYTNEYGDSEPCKWLACSITKDCKEGTMSLIDLDGDLGWCSSWLIEEEY